VPKTLGTYNRKGKIPGVTGKQIPGSAKLPPRRVGGFTTRVPYLSRGQGGSAAFREHHRQQIRDVQGRFAGGWGFAWIGLAAADDALYQWAGQSLSEIKDRVNALADEIKNYMQENAPWTDRSPEEREADGDPPERSARQELQAQVVWNNDASFTIFLGHGAEIYYGIWLEVRWGGRYAILQPTAEVFAPRIAATMKV
jgi:hypothetical protein